MSRNRIVLASLVATATITIGYTARAAAGEVLGAVQSTDSYSPASVQEVAQLDKWRDKKVVFEGTVGKGGCTDCGGVVVSDKTWRIGVEPEDSSKFRIPPRAGARLKVWGTLGISGNGFREVKAHRVEFLDRAAEKRS